MTTTFISVCELILGALLRVRIVRNDRNKFYMDLRVLNDRGLNTTSGLFLQSEDIHQFLQLVFSASSSPGVYTEHMIGAKNRLLLLKSDPSNGYLTILLAKQPGSFCFTGLCLNSKEIENLKNQSEYLITTMSQQQQLFPTIQKKLPESVGQPAIVYSSMPNIHQ